MILAPLSSGRYDLSEHQKLHIQRCRVTSQKDLHVRKSVNTYGVVTFRTFVTVLLKFHRDLKRGEKFTHPQTIDTPIHRLTHD